MDEKEKKLNSYIGEDMTNEEYREELRIIFDNMHENYKLKWYYRFIMEKIGSSN